jgi:predicted nucleic acid-binding protein
MNRDDLCLLDVNVPMYAAGQDHPYREACIWVMSGVVDGRLSAAIDTEIIQEVLYRFGSLRLWNVAIRMANNLLDIVDTIYPVLPADVQLTIDLFERYSPQGIPVRDLIHVAVMQSNAITYIISTDKHFDLIEGITREDPIKLYQRFKLDH